jgi:hypothetical protein
MRSNHPCLPADPDHDAAVGRLVKIAHVIPASSVDAMVDELCTLFDLPGYMRPPAPGPALRLAPSKSARR